MGRRPSIRWESVAKLAAGAIVCGALVMVLPGLTRRPEPPPIEPDIGLPPPSAHASAYRPQASRGRTAQHESQRRTDQAPRRPKPKPDPEPRSPDRAAAARKKAVAEVPAASSAAPTPAASPPAAPVVYAPPAPAPPPPPPAAAPPPQPSPSPQASSGPPEFGFER